MTEVAQLLDTSLVTGSNSHSSNKDCQVNKYDTHDLPIASKSDNDEALSIEKELLEELGEELDTNGVESASSLSSLNDQLIRLRTKNKELEDKLSTTTSENALGIKKLQDRLEETKADNDQLRKTVSNQLSEIDLWKERIESNDKAARKAIDNYKAEFKANIEKLTKKYDECNLEKESIVVKYAQGESKIVQLTSQIEKMEMKLKEKDREKELLAEKVRSVKTESTKTATSLDTKASELAALKKELETQKESVSSHEYRTKWAQNKLKSELEAHKETKTKLEEMTRRYKETKEECVTIRNNCQEMIKTYQESEEIKSNSLDIELKKKEAELSESQHEAETLRQDLNDCKAEVDGLRKQLEIIKKQSEAGDTKIKEFEQMQDEQKKEREDLNGCIKSLREENSQIRNKFHELQSLKHDYEHKKIECNELQQKLLSMEQDYSDHLVELESCKTRDDEMLNLTQKMTERNAELQSQNSVLESKLSTAELSLTERASEVSKLQDTISNLEARLEELQSASTSESSQFQHQLTSKEKLIEKQRQDIESFQTEIRTLKKKQTSSVKELTREVHTLRRQLEAYESKHNDEILANRPNGSGSAPVSLQHSRTNSTSSLDKSDGWTIVNHPRQASPNESIKPLQPSKKQEPAPTETPEPSFMEPDKQKLIEKIVKLQRAHARKNEKLDFCEDHIRQLIEEVQRKNKIIQMYMMKEQTGALSSDDMDNHKPKPRSEQELKSSLARKGGIMASISTMHTQDGKMSLELSLEINNKLQAVLEDSLLKNITLKENMDTLGQEIAKLCAENSKLQEQMQKLNRVS